MLERAGAVPRAEMYRAFNMGVGMVVIVGSDDADAVISSAERAGVPASRLGRVVPGEGRVIIN